MQPTVELLILVLLGVGASEDLFWITAELRAVEWKKGCLTTGGCADPRFKLTETNLASNEQVSISWSIIEGFSQDDSRTFVSHWKRGYPVDLALVCEVVGVDPTYGFPRICDATANIQMFAREVFYGAASRSRSRENPESGKNKLLLELKGKCFNASLTVEKHEQRCPWCLEKLAFVAQPETDNRNGTGILYRLGQNIQLLYLALIVLAGIALLSTAAFACLLTAFIKQKRLGTNPGKSSVESFYPSRVMSGTVKIKDDSRYDTPWDQKYRPLPHWPSTRGPNCSLSRTSPYTTGTLIYQTSRPLTDDSVHYETPTLNDSGHDSV